MDSQFQGLQNWAGKPPRNGINYYNFRVGSGWQFSVQTANESNSATQRAREQIRVIILLCSKVNNLQHRNYEAERKDVEDTRKRNAFLAFQKTDISFESKQKPQQNTQISSSRFWEMLVSFNQAAETKLWETLVQSRSYFKPCFLLETLRKCKPSITATVTHK